MRSRTTGYSSRRNSVRRQSYLHEDNSSVDRRAERFQLQLERPWWIFIHHAEPDGKLAGSVYTHSDQHGERLHKHRLSECLAEHRTSRRECDRRQPELHKDIGSVDRWPERLQLQLEWPGWI